MSQRSGPKGRQLTQPYLNSRCPVSADDNPSLSSLRPLKHVDYLQRCCPREDCPYRTYVLFDVSRKCSSSSLSHSRENQARRLREVNLCLRRGPHSLYHHLRHRNHPRWGHIPLYHQRYRWSTCSFHASDVHPIHLYRTIL